VPDPRVAALLSPHADPRGGGIERFCALLADVLRARGWTPEIVGPPGYPPRWAYRLGAGSLADSRAAGAAAAAIHPQLVVGNGYLGAFSPPVPRVQVFHQTLVGYSRKATGAPWRQRVRWTVGGGLADALAARNATIVAVSDQIADEVRRYCGHRVAAVIPNGVDIERFAPRDRVTSRARLGLPADARIALYVGRLEAGKGSRELRAACAASGWMLAVAGVAAPPGATHLGLLDHERLAFAYTAADCVLFPTYYEGCSYVVLEALASGVPVLTTLTGWMPTLLRAVPAYRALIAPAHDAQAFAARLRDWPAEGHGAVVAAASAFVREHNSLPAWAAAWGALLDRVV
jgi:glycosyltransferase involved in cell wall biosynthesis